LVAPLSKINGFVKVELIDELWVSRPAALTNMSLLVERVNSLCQLLNLLDSEALYEVSSHW